MRYHNSRKATSTETTTDFCSDVVAFTNYLNSGVPSSLKKSITSPVSATARHELVCTMVVFSTWVNNNSTDVRAGVSRMVTTATEFKGMTKADRAAGNSKNKQKPRTFHALKEVKLWMDFPELIQRVNQNTSSSGLPRLRGVCPKRGIDKLPRVH